MKLPENPSQLSPMMQQYAQIKKLNQDKILFYRLGDFYEMFFEDALLVSRELELTLTGRDCGLSERAPMCGVPYHSVDIYIGRLIKRGYKIAICEQTEDPKLAKGLVKREITRIITPGTITESSMLSEDKNNYIACVTEAEQGFGLCFADVSTGMLFVTESFYDINLLIGELSRFEPTEIICNRTAMSDKDLTSFVRRSLGISMEMLYDSWFELNEVKVSVRNSFSEEECLKLAQLEHGCGIAALGALLCYVRETQFEGIKRFTSFELYSCLQHVRISPECQKSLELTRNQRTLEKKGSLLWVLDATGTPMGRRLLHSCIEKPLCDPAAICRRLDAVEELIADSVRLSKIRSVIHKIPDIERLMTRVVYGSCTPRDLVQLSDTSDSLKELKQFTESLQSDELCKLHGSVGTLDSVQNLVRTTIEDTPPALLKDGGYIRTGFSKEVDELRELVHNSKNYLAHLERKVKEQTGIKVLKIGFNKVFGYYIEVPKSSSHLVPDSFVRKQTLSSGERYVNAELKDLENRILSASEKLDILERKLFEDVRLGVITHLEEVQKTSQALALLDLLSCFAFQAQENNYCRPIVDNSDKIIIKNGRHPVVEQYMNGGLFVPNDTLLDCNENLINLITGPNMAGKSTYMRQTALIVLMAQMGSFVPAAQAHIGVVDSIFSRVGSADDIASGDSTFMVEMKEVAHILKNATSRSLVIFDEVGRGTSTYDGMSIARAVVEHVSTAVGARTMFATHYHELTVMEQEFSNIKNYNVAAKKRGDEVAFLRRIVRGPSDDSFGIEVAKLAGLPEETIQRAKQILKSVESEEAKNIQTTLPICKKSGLDRVKDDIFDQLRDIQIETLTPIESMYRLYDLVKLAEYEPEGEDE